MDGGADGPTGCGLWRVHKLTDLVVDWVEQCFARTAMEVRSARASYQAHLCAPDWLLPFFMLRDERARSRRRLMLLCSAGLAAAARYDAGRYGMEGEYDYFCCGILCALQLSSKRFVHRAHGRTSDSFDLHGCNCYLSVRTRLVISLVCLGDELT